MTTSRQIVKRIGFTQSSNGERSRNEQSVLTRKRSWFIVDERGRYEAGESRPIGSGADRNSKRAVTGRNQFTSRAVFYLPADFLPGVGVAHSQATRGRPFQGYLCQICLFNLLALISISYRTI